MQRQKSNPTWETSLVSNQSIQLPIYLPRRSTHRCNPHLSTMHAFLRRHYKARKGGREGKSKREESGPIGVLRYQEAVGKSMDSLLAVASSVSIPPEAKLSPDIADAELRQRSSSRPTPVPPPHYSDQDLTSMERRHSFSGDFSEDGEEAAAARAEACISRSVEASPIRAGTRLGRGDSVDSRDTYRALQKSFLSSLGTSTSFTSERELTDSEDDRSFVSVQTGDSCVFVLSEGMEEEGTVVDEGVGVGMLPLTSTGSVEEVEDEEARSAAQLVRQVIVCVRQVIVCVRQVIICVR